MSRKGYGGTASSRTRSVFHRRGSGPVRPLATAFSYDRIDSAQNPLQFPRATVRAFHLYLLLRVPQEEFSQSLALLADELVDGQPVSSLLAKPPFLNMHSLKTKALSCRQTYLEV